MTIKNTPIAERLSKLFVRMAQNDDFGLMTGRQLAALHLIRENPRSTVRWLAEQLQIPKPVISRALDKFEHFGFVSRSKDPADLRSIYINLLPQGAEYLDQLATIAEETINGTEANHLNR